MNQMKSGTTIPWSRTATSHTPLTTVHRRLSTVHRLLSTVHRPPTPSQLLCRKLWLLYVIDIRRQGRQFL